MRCLGRIIALGLLAFVIVMLPCATWSVALWTVASEPTTYTETLDEDVYNKVAPLVIPALADDVRRQLEHNSTDVATRDEHRRYVDLFINLIDYIPQSNWERISGTVVDGAWVQRELAQQASDVLNYFHGNTNEFDPVINVSPIRENLSGRQGELFVQAIMLEIAQWDMCDLDELAVYGDFLEGERVPALPRCNPATFANEIRVALESVVALVLEQLPVDGQYVLREEIMAYENITEEEYNLGLRDTQSSVIFLDNIIVPLAILVPMLFLGLIVFFAVRSFKEFFIWLGLPLVLGGLLNVLPLFRWLYTASSPLGEVGSSTTLGDLGFEVLLEVIRSLASNITLPILLTTFFMVLVGFVFLVLAAMIKGETKVEQFFYVPSGSGTPTPTPSPFTSGQRSTGSTPVGPRTPPPGTPLAPPPPAPPVDLSSARRNARLGTNSVANEQVSSTASNTSGSTGSLGSYQDDRTFIPTDDEE